MTYMDRVIGGQNNSLFNFINSRVTGRDRLVSIPYIYTANDTFLRYNDRLKRIQSALTGDPFDVRIAEQGTVPGQFAALSPKTVWSEAVVDLTDALTKSFDDGFNKLMEYDSMSVREYLAGKNYTDAEVDWLETMNDATGHYDAAVSQMVLEQWIFTEVSSADWVTFDGGLSRVVNGMIKSIPQPVHYSQRVTAIERETSESLSVSTNDTTRFYHHVINTVPLAAMQVMDMTALELDYGKKLAMRKLNYDPAGKIGMKFKTRWWEHLDQPFKGGQSFSDLPIRRCVYPSYGVNTTDAAGTMIASYTWGQDSSRLGAYMSTPAAIDHLIEITLHDLAAMNNVTQAFLESQFLDAHVWSWYNSEFSGGAFAIFTPGQFSSLLPALLSPAAEGRMHFAGEALSTGHAWIIGALNSAYRTVAEVLAVENRTDLLLELERKWGTVVSFSRCCVL
ncbi:MAG: hypothetical protein M1817_000941 [Caeruleum heppii]|nr:MAG: hypothetical protein M1817_000941 [Caeruleum heppii]